MFRFVGYVIVGEILLAVNRRYQISDKVVHKAEQMLTRTTREDEELAKQLQDYEKSQS